MMFILMMIMELFFAGSDLNAAETVRVFDSPVKMMETLDDNHYLVLEAEGRINICNKSHEVVSTINNASLFRVIDKNRLAVVNGGKILVYRDPYKPNTQPYHTINTGLEISAITSMGDMLIFGTKTGSMHKVRITETTVQFIPGACKTEITGLAAKDNMVVITSLAEHPKLINLSTGFMEGILVPNKDSRDVLNPTRAAAFKPGYYSMDLVIAQGNELLIFDASANGDTAVKRLPKKSYNLSAPVLSINFANNGRFILAGLHNNTAKFIDTSRTDNKGSHIIHTRTGFSAGSILTLTAHPGSGILLGAGKNIYVEPSSGAGQIKLINTSTLTSSQWYSFILTFHDDEYNTVVRESFRFSRYDTENPWLVPEGRATISTTDPNVEIENNEITIDGTNLVTVKLLIKEPEKPEEPRPIVIQPPSIESRPAGFLGYEGDHIVSVHQNKFMISGRTSSRVVTLPDTPYWVSTDSGKTLIALKNKLMVYSCSNGELLNTIPYTDRADLLAYRSDVIAAVAKNTTTIFKNGRSVSTIPQESEITGIDISSDGKLVLLAVGRMVRMFETQTGTEIPLHTHPRKAVITSVAFSAPAPEYSARYFITWTEDGIAQIHDGMGGQELKELNIGQIDYLKFEGNDKLVFHETARNTIRCINLTSGETLYTTAIEGTAFALLSNETVAFVNKSGQTVLRKKSDDLVKICLTEQNDAWYFVSRDNSVPLLFQASESLVPLFTTEDGRPLSSEEIKSYRTAQLPL